VGEGGGVTAKCRFVVMEFETLSRFCAQPKPLMSHLSQPQFIEVAQSVGGWKKGGRAIRQYVVVYCSTKTNDRSHLSASPLQDKSGRGGGGSLAAGS